MPHGPMVFGLDESAGGGGDLTGITSADGSVTIVNGTGPVPDLSVPPPFAGIDVFDNGDSRLVDGDALNFIGLGMATLTVTDMGGGLANVEYDVALPVSDEGVPQGDATTINFVGAGVTASVAAGVATVTIPGGGGGGAGDYAQVALTGSASIGSGSATTISGMSIAIPSNNNFNLNFNADIRPDGSSVFEYFLAKNLVEIPGTRRRVGPLAADRPGSVQILALALVNTDTITARVIRISGAGSITFHDRILQALEH